METEHQGSLEPERLGKVFLAIALLTTALLIALAWFVSGPLWEWVFGFREVPSGMPAKATTMPLEAPKAQEPTQDCPENEECKG